MSVPIHYTVEVLHAHQHLYRISLEIAQAAPLQTVSLPVWIPGSYLVREFAQHLQKLQAYSQGQCIPLQQLNKNSWQVQWPANCSPGPLQLCYEVYAFDASVRTAYLDAQRGFFNPTSLCLRVHGQEQLIHTLTLRDNAHTQDWQVATSLLASDTDARGFGTYLAADYDELADSPFEMGTFWSGTFHVRGVPHQLIISGAGSFADCTRLLRDTERICAAQIAFWHPNGELPPFPRYVFLLHASQEGYGGLEHRHSTALICQRSDLPRHATSAHPAQKSHEPGEGYVTLLGLISHEYFHSWNVKRLRPHDFARYDYDQENYTDLLWFFEGFTSYYDDLFLVRTGLIKENTYLKLLSKTINQVWQTPGRQLQSVAQASFDAWIKYYRVNENSPNATVSYYTKGALVALCLDLTLRLEGHATLDDVMRIVYQRCHAGPMQEADLLSVLADLGRRDYQTDLKNWVHSTRDLPIAHLLPAHHIEWQEQVANWETSLGLRVSEKGGSLHIKNVLRGSCAEKAGFAAGDEWLGIELPATSRNTIEAWRIRKLTDVALYATIDHPITALVARDGRLLQLPFTWPAPAHTIQLKHASPTAHSKNTEAEVLATTLTWPQA